MNNIYYEAIGVSFGRKKVRFPYNPLVERPLSAEVLAPAAFYSREKCVRRGSENWLGQMIFRSLTPAGIITEFRDSPDAVINLIMYITTVRECYVNSSKVALRSSSRIWGRSFKRKPLTVSILRPDGSSAGKFKGISLPGMIEKSLSN